MAKTSATARKRTTKATRATGNADWRIEALERMRTLVFDADPKMLEEQKWKKPSNGMKGVPAWSHDGLVCTGETYKEYVKLTFAYGAELPDPKHVFNAGFGGGTRRAIDIREGETVNAAAFKTLVKAAVARNRANAKGR